MTQNFQHQTHSPGLWHRIGAQLAEPRGLPGRVLANIMDRVNAVPLGETISVVKAFRPNDILEIGFGSGQGIVGLLNACPGSQVFGIDRSADMVARALARNARAVHEGKVQLVMGRADRLPLASSTFDCVMAVNVAYFFRDTCHEMAEFFRVLRPGGRVIFYVTRGDAMARWPFASRSTHRHFDEDDLSSLLKEVAFHDVEIREVRLPLGLTGLIAVGTKPHEMVRWTCSEVR
jgi:SAM-dependent methyltransferase